MPNKPRVRILLDVDGVLNTVTKYPADHWPDWRTVECMGFNITHSLELGARLLTLAQLPGVQLLWLTTWEHNANEWIGPLFDWPEFEVLERHDISNGDSGLIIAESDWWKYDEARELYEADLIPFAWVDDDLGLLDDGALIWATSLGDAALAISPDTFMGITPEQLDQLERFIKGHLDG